MKALKVTCILVLLGLLAVSVPTAAEGPEVAEAPVPDRYQWLPVVYDGVHTAGIEIQNVGGAQTYVDVWFYSSTGALIAGPAAGVPMSPIINGGGASWTYYATIPAAVWAAANTPVSAVVVSWDGTPANQGANPNGYGGPFELVTAAVNRITYPGTGVPAAAYTGIGDPLLPLDEFDGVPGVGNDMCWIYAPVIMNNHSGWYTWLTIQNATWDGDIANVDVQYYDPNGIPVASANINIPPFSSVTLNPPTDPVTGVPIELCSAWIRSTEVVAGVVDEYDSATPANATGFMSYRASPANRQLGGSSASRWAFGPLLFNRYNGWWSGVAIVNVDPNQDAQVRVSFRRTGGAVDMVMMDSIEERSMKIIELPSVATLPDAWVGSISIESMNGMPIIAIVNELGPNGEAMSYNTFRGNAENLVPGVFDCPDGSPLVSAPLMMKFNGPWSAGMQIMNLEDPAWGAATVEVRLYDAAGILPLMPLRFAIPGHASTTFDLRFTSATQIPPGFVGSAQIWSPTLHDLGAIVNLVGPAASDAGCTYASYPVAVSMCLGDIFGKVHSIDACEDDTFDSAEPIEDVVVASGTKSTTTDSTGDYELEDVEITEDTVPVSFSATGFLTYTTTVALGCGEDKHLSAELLCLGEAVMKVEKRTDATNYAVAGALVEYSKPYGTKAAHYPGTHYTTSDTTDASGVVTLTVPILDGTGTITVSESGIETGNFAWEQMDEIELSDPYNIHAGKTLNSEVNDAVDEAWKEFDETDCYNFLGKIQSLDQKAEPLQLCALGSFAGNVKIATVDAPGVLVQAIDRNPISLTYNQVLGFDTTNANGNYVITGLPTGVFGAVAKKPDYRVVFTGLGEKYPGMFTNCGEAKTVSW